MANGLLDRELFVADQLEEETGGDTSNNPDVGTGEGAENPDEELEEEDEEVV